MNITRAREMAITFCLIATLAFINGCAGKAATTVDVKTAGDSILSARESLALARSEEGQEYAQQEFTQAENLLTEAQEALRKGKTQTAMDISFRADMAAKTAVAISREAKATKRASEARDSILRTLWETQTDEVAGAKARRVIAEKLAVEAQEDAKAARMQAVEQTQQSKAELAIAKAELWIDAAEEVEASIYAVEPYNKAKVLTQTAKSSLAAGDFQNAATTAEEVFRHASNALIQARAKREAEFEESLRERDRAVSTMARVEMSLDEAKGSLAGHYAEDMYKKAEELLGEVRLALDAKDYGLAESLADQALVSATNALAVSEAEERETQVREAQEDAQANALDALAKAERSLTEAQAAQALELAQDTYRKAEAALNRAKQAVTDEDFERAVLLAQESESHSVTAFTMAQAKTERLRKIEEIENKVIEEAGKISEVTARRTNRGVVISMGGNLFAKGSDQISSEAKVRLKSIAEILKKYPEYKVVIEGHTDSIGSDENNLKISRERSNNFLTYMADQEGIPLERLSSIGYGESRPIASNVNEEGRRQNRRVDIVILTAPVSP